MKNQLRTTSVRAVIRNGDKILVEWFAPKSISFLPGGTLKDEEDIRVALVRELNEEIEGVAISVGRYLGRVGHIWKTPAGIDSCLNHFYEATILEGRKPKAKEVGRIIKWLSLRSENLTTLQPPKLRELLLEDAQTEWEFMDSEA